MLQKEMGIRDRTARHAELVLLVMHTYVMSVTSPIIPSAGQRLVQMAMGRLFAAGPAFRPMLACLRVSLMPCSHTPLESGCA